MVNKNNINYTPAIDYIQCIILPLPPPSLPSVSAVMKKFDHPHIIKLIGVVYNKKQLYIIMELAPLGQVRLNVM